jgi:hypothetical protein
MLAAPRRHRRFAAALLVAVAALCALAGCGKSSARRQTSDGVETVLVHVGAGGASATATRNTTRLGGSSPVADAAAVARAAYPGLTAATRPLAVAVAAVGDWPAALAASSLASAPLGAPLLYAEGSRLPAASLDALAALNPRGASTLGGAQVLLLGPTIESPAGYQARGTSTGEPASLAASVAQLLTVVQGASPRQAIVVALDGPPALAMPAAGLAAESGAPILFVTKDSVPPATAVELERLHKPTIYTVGSTAIDERVLGELGRYGPVKRAEAGEGEDATVAGNAVAVARFSDGAFGWGVREPGHGLAFANASRPFDAPAAAILSATGDYAPLLLLEQADVLPHELSTYLSDIQPAAPSAGPVKGIYNHGWLVGDESAISANAQAEIDGLLEIAPGSSSTATPSSPPTSEE